MSGMLLSCAEMPVIKQIADLLGIIMNAIFFVFEKVGIANIGLCIIVFTFLVKLLMIPLTIKQQKTTKLSSLINPEVQAIQKKYKGKNDNNSIMAMNTEINAVYQKYGTSPTGGCLPMLIPMLILLALYGVISNIPSHVGAVEELYTDAAGYISESIDDYDKLNKLNQIMVNNEIAGFEKQDEFDEILEAYYDEKSDDVVGDVYTILSNSYKRQATGLNTSKDSWDDMNSLKETSEKILAAVETVSDADWKKIKSSELSEYELKIVSEYSEYDKEAISGVLNEIESNWSEMEQKRYEIKNVYSFAGIDLSRSPSQEMEVGIWWAIFIPILSALSQWYSTRMSMKTQPSMEGNPMASSMKVMNVMMPLMSAFFCYSFAAGLGLYWVVSAVFQIGQQFFVNEYFKKMEVEDIIKASVEKANKKREKMGLPPQKITETANTSLKGIKANAASVSTKTDNQSNKNNKNVSSNVKYKEGGIAAKANMVKQYNDKNVK